MKTPGSHNRWYHMMPVYRSIFSVHGRLREFFLGLDSQLATVSALVQLLSDMNKYRQFVMELATMVIMGRELEIACYTLEGDGALSFIADEVLQSVLAKFAPTAQLPGSLLNVMRSLYGEDHLFNANIAYARSLLVPCYNYLCDQMVKNSSTYHLLKVARFWHPQLARPMTKRQFVDVLSPSSSRHLYCCY